ncbi:MAG: hypothetical protein AB1696_07810 [Planctomycetota bacterium]
MLRRMIERQRSLPLLPAFVLVVSTALMAADSPVLSKEEKERRSEQARHRAETFEAFKAAQSLYHRGLWMQARDRLLRLQRDGADLGLFHEQRIKGYLKLIELKVDGLCADGRMPCVERKQP